MTKRIPLSQGRFAVVDDCDHESVNAFKWSCSRSGNKEYAVTNMYNGKNNIVSMHRFLLGNSCGGLFVDHIDGNGLNNQRSNLRTCTHEENMRNRAKSGRNKYKGVHFVNGRWQGVIKHGDKFFSLGTYATQEEAAAAYDKKAKELFGKFARLNFPEGEK